METRLFDLFKVILLAHIQTKVTCTLFHEKSQDFYELLFDCFHQISEKKQDIEQDKPGNEEELVKATYSALEEAKSIIAKMVEEDNSIGMDNLLRGLHDKLEFACGNARGFIEEEKEDTKPTIKRQNAILIPR
jgi:DNA-binding ferritin-like protein